MKKGLSVMLLGVTTLLLSLAACSSGETHGKTTEGSVEKEKVEKKTSSLIDYNDQKHWEFESGKMQSPINILTKDVQKMTADEGAIQLDYKPTITKAENNGHSIQITAAGQAKINGRYFTLNQFHFHAKSEHTIDGKHYPIEAHFVHTADDGRLAVIGVFFKEGKENQGFAEVLDDVKGNKTAAISHLEEMIPTKKSYYHYLGSLTTPPLTENVEWYIMKEPVEVSSEQIKAFQKLYSHNSRDTQPLNDRVVLEYDE